MRHAVLVAAALLGCRGESKAPDPDRRQTTLAVPDPQVRTDSVTPRQDPVVLVDAGSEPRAALRYAIAPESTQHLALETHAKGRQVVGSKWSELAELPVMKTEYTITAAGNGALTVEAGEGPAEGAWALIAGRRFQLIGDDQQRFGGLGFADGGPIGRASLDEVAQRLLALSVPVPGDPVGIGGTWRVVTLLRQRPALVKQTATYTLLARDAARWKVGVELVRIAEPQTAEDPGLPTGTSVDVVALVVRISGQLQIAPSRAFPTGELATSSTMHIKIKSAAGVAEQLFEDQSRIQIR